MQICLGNCINQDYEMGIFVNSSEGMIKTADELVYSVANEFNLKVPQVGYETILADPPWRFENRTFFQQYMTITQITSFSHKGPS